MSVPSRNEALPTRTTFAWHEHRLRRVMVVGTGRLGLRILEGLARLGPRIDVLAAGRSLTTVQTRANLAMLAATHASPEISRIGSVRVDLAEIEETTETLARWRPDIVVNCATLQPYEAIAALPPETRRGLGQVGLGPWLSTHLAPAERLMQAVKTAAIGAQVINCAYPDAVNPALATVGLQPLTGIGNVANNVPALRLAIADALSVAFSAVSVDLVMHHYVSHRIHRRGDAGGAPYHVSYCVDAPADRLRVTSDELFGRLAARYRRATGSDDRLMPAESALALIAELCDGRGRKLHAPGPLGMVGGYPVRVSSSELAISLPPEVDLGAAIELNRAAQRFDGIQDIGPGGCIRFTPQAVAVVDELLGHSCEQFHVEDAWEWARELRARCAEGAGRG